ncbi:hypothetical protein DPMN_068646 [Dreissena polymorpha]|uniref:Uncharacterized protein n=1 Tax=Dreissena polymorpha TaxID=45954 RepID=A0A9D3Z2U7_DREPO|nr:hypothetical protein DPMN_068646 [Dreissena polymorpha]
MADGGDARKAYREIKQLLHELNGHNCTVYLYTVAPRRDADVVPLNDIIKQICEETDAKSIEMYTASRLKEWRFTCRKGWQEE